jgi:hypothetical protein
MNDGLRPLLKVGNNDRRWPDGSHQRGSTGTAPITFTNTGGILIEPCSEQIAFARPLRFHRSHRALRPMGQPNMNRDSRETSKMKLQASEASNPKSLQNPNRRQVENRLQPNGLKVVHG